MLEPLILIGLASWRIASLLVNEDGPALVFDHLRAGVGLGREPGEVSGFLPLLFSCIWCMSVWTTPLMYVVWLLEPRAVMIVAAMAVALIPEALHGSSFNRH